MSKPKERFYRLEDKDNGEILIEFYCPGCKYGHAFSIGGRGPNWTWNGDLVKGTFSPSLLVNGHWPEGRCHSFVREGQIQFLDDCWHDLRGQTVDVPDWED